MAEPQLRVVGPDGSALDFLMRRGRLSLGSSEASDILLRGAGILERHIEVRSTDAALTVVPLEGARVWTESGYQGAEFVLEPGMAARIGDYELSVSPPGEPRQFGRYKILGAIAEGSMGILYEAEQAPLGRRVALKVLQPRGLGSVRAREQMVEEWRALAAIDHPNVVPIFDAGVVEGEPYLAMRLLQGGNLAAQLARRGKVSPSDTIALLGGVAAALDAAHEAGVVHRDVKPSNILLSNPSSRQALLSDFGVASTSVSSARPAGTRGYIAPEIVAGGTPSSGSDQFSLTVVLYQCLSGDRLRSTQSDGTYGATYDISEGLRDVANQLGPEIVRVIQRGLNPDPTRRFASCRDLIAAAASCLGVTPPEADRVLEAGLTIVGTQTFSSARGMATTTAASGNVSWPEQRARTGVSKKVLGTSATILVVGALAVGGYFLSRPQIPTAPQSFTGSGRAFEVRLSWAPPSNEVEVTSYVLKRGTTQVATIDGAGPLTWTDRSAEPGSAYDYTIVARAEDGDSPPVTTIVSVPDVPPSGVRLNGRYFFTLEPSRAYGYSASTDSYGTLYFYLSLQWQCPLLKACDSIPFTLDFNFQNSTENVIGTLVWDDGAWVGQASTYGWTDCGSRSLRTDVFISVAPTNRIVSPSSKSVDATRLQGYFSMTTPASFLCDPSGTVADGAGVKQ